MRNLWVKFNQWRMGLASFLRTNPTAARYAMDGLLVAAAMYIVGNNNNLFATRLGAGDYQLSLIQFMPHVVNLIILIPGGLMTDTLHNKRKMVTGTLLLSAFLYMLIGFAPFLPFLSGLSDGILNTFILLLSLATGGMTLFNLSWQSFFPEVVAVEARNRVLTLRTQVFVFIGVVAPLATGAVLAVIPSTGGKILAHQSFFFAAALILVACALNFGKFQAANPVPPKNVSLGEVKNALRALSRNKAFLAFAGTALLFYFSWQMDWTLYYIGQVRYLRMNEFLLGLAVVGATGMQFASLRFWSRQNERFGVVFPVAFGILGLGLCPLSMIAATSLPPAIAPYAFIIFNTLANTCFVTITLNMFQCLLQVLDVEYRSLAISFYTCLTCFSNAVMPVAGVALYQALGGDLPALKLTFWIVFAIRILATGLWLLRWRHMPKPAEEMAQVMKLFKGALFKRKFVQ
jgi:MFS family permease